MQTIVDLGHLLYHFDAEIVECVGGHLLVPGETLYTRRLAEISLHGIENHP